MQPPSHLDLPAAWRPTFAAILNGGEGRGEEVRAEALESSSCAPGKRRQGDGIPGPNLGSPQFRDFWRPFRAPAMKSETQGSGQFAAALGYALPARCAERRAVAFRDRVNRMRSVAGGHI